MERLPLFRINTVLLKLIPERLHSVGLVSVCMVVHAFSSWIQLEARIWLGGLRSLAPSQASRRRLESMAAVAREASFGGTPRVDPTEVPAKEQDVLSANGSHTAMTDQYNQADFAETYSDARFFIIKLYSEDDVHKSVKYNVWASIPNGNKKLDTTYQEAKEKSSETPVFLLF